MPAEVRDDHIVERDGAVNSDADLTELTDEALRSSGQRSQDVGMQMIDRRDC